MSTPSTSRLMRPNALALVEVIVSIAILGGLTAAVMTAVASSALLRARSVERAQGAALAEALMGEILAQRYTDPGTPVAGNQAASINILGITVTLSTPGGAVSRSAFDSLDDYHGWRASPPIDRNGTPLLAFKGWTHEARVDRVSTTDAGGSAVGTDTGLKRITVIVWHDGREVARHVALRSLAWEEVLDAR